MQRIILTIVLLLGFVTVKSQSTNLTGKWIGVQEGDTAIFEFTKAGFVIITGEILGDDEAIGGKNFPMETENGDSIWLDFKYKTDTKNPNYFCMVMYHANTDKPYCMMPFFINPISTGVMEFSYLDMEDEAGEGGILYTAPADWEKVNKYIADAKVARQKGPLPDTVMLTKMK